MQNHLVSHRFLCYCMKHHYIQLVCIVLSFPYKEKLKWLIWFGHFSVPYLLLNYVQQLWLTELLNSIKLKDISGVWFDAHNWPISALKLLNSSSFKSRCFRFDLSPVIWICLHFIKKFGLTEVNIIYLLFWTISSPKYLNILTFSVATENTLHRGSITICLKLLVQPPEKSSTCVISKSCNSFLKCLKNNASSKWLNLTPSLSNSSLTHKCQFFEASDKPSIQVFNSKQHLFLQILVEELNIQLYFFSL